MSHSPPLREAPSPASAPATEQVVSTPRVGLLGGTFDPPHIGHLVVAREAAEALGLDIVALVPAGEPPHKDPESHTSALLRHAMVAAAVQDDRRLVVLDTELRRPGPSRTVDTMEALVGPRPPGLDPIHLLMGSDQWASFPDWYRHRRIMELARIVVLTRSGEGRGPGPESGALEVSVSRLDISSTDLRARVREGRSIRDLVPDAVRRIIDSEGLYR